jgi:Zn ribbon nucleic-acid-binding protein
VHEESRGDADDERPPICPACGVTMGIVVDEEGVTRYVCLECGFSDELTARSAHDRRRTYAGPDGH